MTHQHFFSFSLDKSLAMPEQYSLSLVFLSYFVAVIAGYCANSLMRFIHTKQNTNLWMIAFGSVILGLGVWSMHFIGMLAFSLPIPVQYDVTITLISILPAILGSFLCLHFLKRDQQTTRAFIINGLLLASGIASMHFIGMGAMSVQASMVHEPIMFVFSILVSWALAVLTLFIQTEKLNLSAVFKFPISISFASAITFGFSVATMHYLAMQSAYFFPLENEMVLTGIDVESLELAVLLGIVLLIVCLSLVLNYKSKIFQLKERATAKQIQIEETIENMTDPFLLTDVNGKVLLSNHRFTDCFPALAKVINQQVATVAELLSIFTEHYLSDENRQEQKSLKEKFFDQQECSFQTKDGQTWLFRQTETNSNNHILTWTNVSNEVKQREALQETEEKLTEAERLASIGKLVTNVAHELNTPIGIAITSLSCIKQDTENISDRIASGKLSKTMLESYVEQVAESEVLASRNVGRAASIIRQFKHISTSEYAERASHVSLYDTFKTIEKGLVNDSNAKQVSLKIEVEKPLEVETFEDVLFQVIKALFKNSIVHGFATREHGDISINVIKRDNSVLIQYADDGCGIDEEIADKIFDPFVSSKRFEGNIGLGLHIAHNLVFQKLKGSIELVPSDNAGCYFEIELPMAIQSSE